jgi:hypothetical protein
MDFSDIATLQAEIYACLDKQDKMRDEFAVARQIAEYDGERRKMLLAKAVQDAPGKSIAEREVNARASQAYYDALTVLAGAYIDSQRVISRYHGLQSKMDALRSILSTQKAMAQI